MNGEAPIDAAQVRALMKAFFRMNLRGSARRIAALEPKAGLAPRAPSNRKGGWAAGGIGAVLVALLTKGKFLLLGLTKLPTLMSFFISAALWRGDGAGS